MNVFIFCQVSPVLLVMTRHEHYGVYTLVTAHFSLFQVRTPGFYHTSISTHSAHNFTYLHNRLTMSCHFLCYHVLWLFVSVWQNFQSRNMFQLYLCTNCNEVQYGGKLFVHKDIVLYIRQRFIVIYEYVVVSFVFITYCAVSSFVYQKQKMHNQMSRLSRQFLMYIVLYCLHYHFYHLHILHSGPRYLFICDH